MDDALNPPAFPTESEHQSGHQTWHYEGMRLRDYFAAKAMQALLSNDTAMTEIVSSNPGKAVGDAVAKQAWNMADAMLEARKQ